MGLEWFTTVGMFRWMQDMTYIHEVRTSTPIERTVFFTFGHSLGCSGCRLDIVGFHRYNGHRYASRLKVDISRWGAFFPPSRNDDHACKDGASIMHTRDGRDGRVPRLAPKCWREPVVDRFGLPDRRRVRAIRCIVRESSIRIR